MVMGGILCPFQQLKGRRNKEIEELLQVWTHHEEALSAVRRFLIKVSTCSCFQGLYLLISASEASAAPTECDQLCTQRTWSNLSSFAPARVGVVSGPRALRRMAAVLAGLITRPRRSLYNLVPVLNIDSARGTLLLQVKPFFPFSTPPLSALSHLISRLCLHWICPLLSSPSSCPVSPHLHTSLALSCVRDSITLVSSC